MATLPPDEYPPEGQEFFKAFAEKYGDDEIDPYAIYGYEAMNLALDAIERSKTGNKEDVLKALFETKDRASVLGTYSIDENGDTTLTDYGVYSIKDNALAFDQVIKSATSSRVRPDDAISTGGRHPPPPGQGSLAPPRSHQPTTWKPPASPRARPPPSDIQAFISTYGLIAVLLALPVASRSTTSAAPGT